MVVQATKGTAVGTSAGVVKGHRNGGSSNQSPTLVAESFVVKGHRNGGSSNTFVTHEKVDKVVKGHRNGGSSNPR